MKPFDDDKLSANSSSGNWRNLLHVVFFKLVQMLARGVIEERLLSFVTQDMDTEDNGEPISHKVITNQMWLEMGIM